MQEFCKSAEIRFEGVRRRGLFGERKALKRGERLFSPGEAQVSVYVVRSGALKTVSVSQDGDVCVLGFHVPGELVGLDALATGAHVHEAVALSETHVCAIAYDALTSLTADSPALNRQLLQRVGQGALDSQTHVQVLLRRQAGGRIALFLLSLLQRYQRGSGARMQLTLPMSREDIGRYLGLALETVSRGLTRLQEDGVLKVSGRQVQVLDHAALERLALHGAPDSFDGEIKLDRHG